MAVCKAMAATQPLLCLGGKLSVYPHRKSIGQLKLCHLRRYAATEKVEHTAVTFHHYLAVKAEDGVVAMDAEFARAPFVGIEIIHVICVK